MSRSRIFQIYYDDATRAGLDPDFEPFDNLSNEQPLWREYLPMRRFFESNTLEDDCYYGFLSPKFHAKTGLTGRQVRQFVEGQGNADVVTFSPYPDQAALYFNVFEQGENVHPGIAETAQEFFRVIGMPTELHHLVMDGRNTVYCNYFVAKASFWKRWNRILGECMRHAAEASSPLHGRLNAMTTHNYRPILMWVMMMERLTSVLLTRSDEFSVANYPSFRLHLDDMRLQGHATDLIALEAVKRSYIDSRDPYFMRSFRTCQFRLMQACGVRAVVFQSVCGLA
ncbi:MAG: hypothetical protein P4L83_09600 [Nevskia sp.]|nr:hypothetical protein [Nevskia sp.]